MKLRLMIFLLLAASCQAATYVIHTNTAPSTSYTTIETTAACGDTITIDAGTYNLANGNIFRLRWNKTCTAGNPVTITATDPNNPPVFDFTGTALDSQASCAGFPGSYGGSDCNRGAWQFNGAYVTITYIHIKGVSATATDSAAAIRSVTNTDHMIIGHCIIETSYNGWQGTTTNATLEYNQFLNNGRPGSDQQHQVYDGGGDQFTFRYNYLNDGGCASCGQNLHGRSWHAFVYGNWFQDASLYEADMMTPDGTHDPGDHIMHHQYYGNVFVTNATPGNTAKVFAFSGDNGGFTGTMDMKWMWNSVYIRATSGGGGPSFAPNADFGYAMFQINNYTNGCATTGCIQGGVTMTFTNNVMGAVTFSGSWVPSLLLIACGTGACGGDTPSSWTVSGDKNWFRTNYVNDGETGKNCSSGHTDFTASANGTCTLTNTTAAATQPATNLATLNFIPNASGAYGSADTTQTLKTPVEQYAPTTYYTPPSYTDRGALLFSAGALNPDTCSITTPAANATVTGTTSSIVTTGTPGQGTINSWQALMDGSPTFMPSGSSTTLNTTFDTTKFTNGAHTVGCTCGDTSGGTGTCAGVAVTVSNTFPAGTLQTGNTKRTANTIIQ